MCTTINWKIKSAQPPHYLADGTEVDENLQINLIISNIEVGILSGNNKILLIKKISMQPSTPLSSRAHCPTPF